MVRPYLTISYTLFPLVVDFKINVGAVADHMLPVNFHLAEGEYDGRTCKI